MGPGQKRVDNGAIGRWAGGLLPNQFHPGWVVLDQFWGSFAECLLRCNAIL
jgi:hypothetical protein